MRGHRRVRPRLQPELLPARDPGGGLREAGVHYNIVQYRTVQYSTVQYSVCTGGAGLRARQAAVPAREGRAPADGRHLGEVRGEVRLRTLSNTPRTE